MEWCAPEWMTMQKFQSQQQTTLQRKEEVFAISQPSSMLDSRD
jgi:hypothetical protein